MNNNLLNTSCSNINTIKKINNENFYLNKYKSQLNVLYSKSESSSKIVSYLKEKLKLTRLNYPTYYDLIWFLVSNLITIELKHFFNHSYNKDLCNLYEYKNLNLDSNNNLNRLYDENEESNIYNINVKDKNKYDFEYNNSLKTYLERAIKNINPLPNSKWEVNNDWKKLKIFIHKILSRIYKKENNVIKAVENIKLAINIDRNCILPIEEEFIELYLNISNNFICNNEHKSAILLLENCEKFFENKYNFSNLLSKKLINNFILIKNKLVIYIDILKKLSKFLDIENNFNNNNFYIKYLKFKSIFDLNTQVNNDRKSCIEDKIDINNNLNLLTELNNDKKHDLNNLNIVNNRLTLRDINETFLMYNNTKLSDNINNSINFNKEPTLIPQDSNFCVSKKNNINILAQNNKYYFENLDDRIKINNFYKLKTYSNSKKSNLNSEQNLLKDIKHNTKENQIVKKYNNKNKIKFSTNTKNFNNLENNKKRSYSYNCKYDKDNDNLKLIENKIALQHKKCLLNKYKLPPIVVTKKDLIANKIAKKEQRNIKFALNKDKIKLQSKLSKNDKIILNNYTSVNNKKSNNLPLYVSKKNNKLLNKISNSTLKQTNQFNKSVESFKIEKVKNYDIEIQNASTISNKVITSNNFKIKKELYIQHVSKFQIYSNKNCIDINQKINSSIVMKHTPLYNFQNNILYKNNTLSNNFKKNYLKKKKNFLDKTFGKNIFKDLSIYNFNKYDYIREKKNAKFLLINSSSLKEDKLNFNTKLLNRLIYKPYIAGDSYNNIFLRSQSSKILSNQNLIKYENSLLRKNFDLQSFIDKKYQNKSYSLENINKIKIRFNFNKSNNYNKISNNIKNTNDNLLNQLGIDLLKTHNKKQEINTNKNLNLLKKNKKNIIDIKNNKNNSLSFKNTFSKLINNQVIYDECLYSNAYDIIYIKLKNELKNFNISSFKKYYNISTKINFSICSLKFTDNKNSLNKTNYFDSNKLSNYSSKLFKINKYDKSLLLTLLIKGNEHCVLNNNIIFNFYININNSDIYNSQSNLKELNYNSNNNQTLIVENYNYNKNIQNKINNLNESNIYDKNILDQKIKPELYNILLRNVNENQLPLLNFFLEKYITKFIDTYNSKLNNNINSQFKINFYKNTKNVQKNIEFKKIDQDYNNILSNIKDTNRNKFNENNTFNTNNRSIYNNKQEINSFDSTSLSSAKKYLNLLISYFQVNKNNIGYVFEIKDINKELIFIDNINYYIFIFKIVNDLRNLFPTNLATFLVNDNNNYNIFKNNNYETIIMKNKYFNYICKEYLRDDLICHNYIIYKSSFKIRSALYCNHSSKIMNNITMRQFSNCNVNHNIETICTNIDIKKSFKRIMFIIKIKKLSSIFDNSNNNLDKSKIISINPSIIGLFKNYCNQDNVLKSKNKSKYSTILEFNFHDMTKGSFWYDKIYLSWEDFINFFNFGKSFNSFFYDSLFFSNRSLTNFLNSTLCIKSIIHNYNKDSAISYFDIFCYYLTFVLIINNSNINLNYVLGACDIKEKKKNFIFYEFKNFLLCEFENYINNNVACNNFILNKHRNYFKFNKKLLTDKNYKLKKLIDKNLKIINNNNNFISDNTISKHNNYKFKININLHYKKNKSQRKYYQIYSKLFNKNYYDNIIIFKEDIKFYKNYLFLYNQLYLTKYLSTSIIFNSFNFNILYNNVKRIIIKDNYTQSFKNNPLSENNLAYNSQLKLRNNCLKNIINSAVFLNLFGKKAILIFEYKNYKIKNLNFFNIKTINCNKKLKHKNTYSVFDLNKEEIYLNSNNIKKSNTYIKDILVKLKLVCNKTWYISELKSKVLHKLYNLFTNCKNKEILLKHQLQKIITLETNYIGKYVCYNYKISKNYNFFSNTKYNSSKLDSNINNILKNVNIIKKISLCIDCKDEIKIKNLIVKRIKFVSKIFSTKDIKLIINFKVYNSFLCINKYNYINNISVSKDIINKRSLFKEISNLNSNFICDLDIENKNYKTVNNYSSNIYNSLLFKDNLYNKSLLKFKRENFNSKHELSYFSFVYLYEPKIGKHYYFILSSIDIKNIFNCISIKTKLKRKFITNFYNLIEFIPKKLTLMNFYYKENLCIKLTKIGKFKSDIYTIKQSINDNFYNNNVNNLKDNTNFNILDEDKELYYNWLNTQLFLKINSSRLLVNDSIYEFGTSETKLIYKTIKNYYIKKSKDDNYLTNSKKNYNNLYFEFKLNKKYKKNIDNQLCKLECLISVIYNKQLNNWCILFVFLKTKRKFYSNIHQSDLEKIPREYFNKLNKSRYLKKKNFNIIEDNEIDSENEQDVKNKKNYELSQEDIWEFIIKNSYLVNNKENNTYIEIFNGSLKNLLKEYICFSTEILSNNCNLCKTEIVLKSNKRFCLDDISNIVKHIPFNTEIILHSYIYDLKTWDIQIYKIDEFEELLNKYVINQEDEIKIVSEQKYDNYIKKVNFNIKNNKNIKDINYDTVKKTISINQFTIKKFWFGVIKKLGYLILKYYRESINLNYDYSKNPSKYLKLESILKGVNNIKELSSKTKSKAMDEILEKIIYNNKLMYNINLLEINKNKILQYERVIYSETILINPNILGFVIINTNKEILIIKLYYIKNKFIQFFNISYNNLKKHIFPFIGDLVGINEKDLGKRVLYYYKDIINKNKTFLKLCSVFKK